ncbi:MAG: ATP-binding protein [Actinomycetota bacterium]
MTKVEIEIPARSAYVGVVRLALASLARAAGLSEESVDDLKIAVGEACANAVIFNEERAPDAPVSVNWSQEPDRVIVEVAGAGQPYDEDASEAGEDLVARMKMSLALLQSLVDSCEVAERSGGGMSARLIVNL